MLPQVFQSYNLCTFGYLLFYTCGLYNFIYTACRFLYLTVVINCSSHRGLSETSKTSKKLLLEHHGYTGKVLHNMNHMTYQTFELISHL